MLLRSANAIGAVPGNAAPVPVPPQVPVTEGHAALPGTRLWYWDTGGEGQAIVLLHPASVSSEIWLYQQPVFAAAGYRVIAYSRRGYFRSDPVPESDPGPRSADLGNLLNFLNVERCRTGSSSAAR
jgi:pimeloyl-ACP methyl ester carboxylesterase